jgi:hypothetical protein
VGHFGMGRCSDSAGGHPEHGEDAQCDQHTIVSVSPHYHHTIVSVSPHHDHSNISVS